MLARLLWWLSPGVHTQHIHRPHSARRIDAAWYRYEQVGRSLMRGT